MSLLTSTNAEHRDAPVVKTTPYGCFVRLGPVYQGLVHKLEMDVDPVGDPAVFAREHGNVLDVEVIEILGSKLSLSRCGGLSPLQMHTYAPYACVCTAMTET